jgi:antirestriction protein ArdC
MYNNNTTEIVMKKQSKKLTIKQVQQDITDRVVASLEQGHTWQRAFNGLIGGLPKSVSTGKSYTGCNTILLAMRGYTSADWGTYKAWQSKGGQVKKGEKGTKIIFSRPVFDKEDPETIAYFATRSFTVFNVEQVEIDAYEYGTADASEYVDMTECSLMSFFQADNAPSLAVGAPAYAPQSDTIKLPNTWINENLASGTIAHEIIHSTGHKSRLNRDGVVKFDKFGSHQYSVLKS